MGKAESMAKENQSHKRTDLSKGSTMKIQQTFRYFAIGMLYTMCVSVFPISAETIVIPVMQQGSEELRKILPQAGESMRSVEQRLGSPITKRGPVGDPPITTWTYPEFTVYFEHSHVLHSVVNPKRR